MIHIRLETFFHRCGPDKVGSKSSHFESQNDQNLGEVINDLFSVLLGNVGKPNANLNLDIQYTKTAMFYPSPNVHYNLYK
jgi:hypothetical protein